MELSTPKQLLFSALISTISECSGAVCGQTCGQRALLDQVRHPLPPPVQKGSSCCSGFGVLYLWRSLNASHFCPSGVSGFSTPKQRIRPVENTRVTPRLSPVRSHHGERDCSPEDPAASVGVLFHPPESRTGECLPVHPGGKCVEFPTRHWRCPSL